MRFWDSSAIVPLLVEEPESERLDAVGRQDRLVAVWWGTLVEVAAAIERQHRGGRLTEEEREEADSRLAVVAGKWITVGPSPGVRSEAVRQARVHGLTGADAFQLAAAIMWAKGLQSGHEFVTLDHELRRAALREGFSLLPQ